METAIFMTFLEFGPFFLCELAFCCCSENSHCFDDGLDFDFLSELLVAFDENAISSSFLATPETALLR